MKLRVLAATVAALTLTAGIATAQTKPAPAKAAAPAAKPAGAADTAAMPVVDKTHASYAFGWQLGQELANTEAKADIELDGKILAASVPATMLLHLEGKLKALRELYLAIPTLPPGESWERNEVGNHEVTTKTVRTQKVLKNHVQAPATERHPAQVQTYSEDVRVGLAVTVKETSVLSVKDKSDLLARLDRLAVAVKQARQRANMTEVPKADIGKKLFAFIHGTN